MTARYPLVINGTSVQEVQSGDSIIVDDLSVSNSVTISNTTAHTGAATFSNTITVTGAATLSNSSVHTGNATFSNTIAVTGNSTFSNTIAVTGSATFSNTIAVTGLSSLNGGLSTVRITANNSSNGTSGQVLTSGGASGNVYWASLSGSNTSFVSLDGSTAVGAIYTQVNKSDPQYGFTSSGPWTTFYTYGAVGNDTNSTTQAWHLALGDGYSTSGSTNYMWTGSYSTRQLMFSSSNRVGVAYKPVNITSNPTSYTGVGFTILPIRNPTASPITTTIYWVGSQYWSAGYEGLCWGYFAPNVNASYSGVSGGTWTPLNSVNGTSSYNSNYSASITIPANTTYIFMGASSLYYYTTYQFYDTNAFYNLNTWLGAGLICDMRMLATLAYCKFDSAGYTTQGAYLAYPACASAFGDR